MRLFNRAGRVLSDALFSPKPAAVKTCSVLLLILFLLGIYHWGRLFNWGELSYQTHDWVKQYKYYTVLKEFVSEGKVPYHVSEKFQTTDRFFGNPEIDFSPQILSLKFLTVKQYLLYNLLFFYLLGFIGLLLLKRKFNLSLFTFSVLAALFNFNGYITSHFVMGHYMWITYFLFPFFFYLLFNLFEGKNPKRTWILLAVVMFFVYLNAAPHTYVWLMLFLIMFGVFNFSKSKYVLYIVLANISLLFFRIAPNAITYFENLGARPMGYFSAGNLLEALTVFRFADYLPCGGKYKWWEYDAFIDVTGLAIILFFGVWLSLSKKHKDLKFDLSFLYYPLLALFLFSLSGLYYPITLGGAIPLLNSENVTTRFIIVPLAGLFIISAARMEQYLHLLKKPVHKITAFLGLGFLIGALFTHSYVWQATKIENLFRDPAISLAVSIVEKNEPFYKAVVDYSPIVSLLAIGVLVVMYLRAGKKKSLSK